LFQGVPQQYEIGSAMDDQPTILKILYWQKYYDVLDLIKNCVRSRFDQPGYNTYKNLQELLFKVIKGDNFESELQYVSQFYQDDINSANLQIQLQILTHDCPREEYTSIFDIRNYMKSLSPAKKQLMAEVCSVKINTGNASLKCH